MGEYGPNHEFAELRISTRAVPPAGASPRPTGYVNIRTRRGRFPTGPTASWHPPRSGRSECSRYRKVSGRLETVPYGGVRFPELLRQGRPMDGPYGRTFVGREYFHYGMIATGDHGYLYRCAMPHPADHLPTSLRVRVLPTRKVAVRSETVPYGCVRGPVLRCGGGRAPPYIII